MIVDIHSHILHGLDDGARSLDVSIGMVKAAYAAGTTDIVATPHGDSKFSFQPDLIRERITELKAAAAASVRIHHGCDFHLTFDNVADALIHPAKYTINNKRYLLVELSDMVLFKTTEPDFLRLQEAGMLLVITHPERNPLLRQRLETLRRWVAMGCYLQITGQSLFGRFGSKAKDFADRLLEESLVHFIASDGHDLERRPPTLDQAFQHVAKRFGDQSAAALFSINPLAVLNGEPIPASAGVQPAARRKWFLPWR